jgi:phage/plasmid-associated DNA primase
MTTKSHYIELLRTNGFNCFPIPKNNGKQPDSRYLARQTPQNQPILDHENYGFIPSTGAGTAIIDVDKLNPKTIDLVNEIKQKYLVSKTGKGFHIPVKGLDGDISKVMLYSKNNYDEQSKNSPSIEVMSPDQQCMGIGSEIYHDKLSKNVVYENIGTDVIWDLKGIDFNSFVDQLAVKTDTVGKQFTKNQNYQQRQRFQNDQLPMSGTSNNYFFNSALQCNSDGMSKEEATEKIKVIYDKWKQSPTFSGRKWVNILKKIDDVYDNNIIIEKGRKRTDNNQNDILVDIATEIISSKKLYSDIQNEILFENQNNFLIDITKTIQKEIISKNPELTKHNVKEIIFKIIALVDPLPPFNPDLIRFKNVCLNRNLEPIESTDLAIIQFPNYNYIPDPEPKKWLKIMFENIPLEQHSRLKAGLKSILSPRLDPRISTILGKSGTGKSTGLNILARVMGDYALDVELEQLLEDSFIKAKIKGKFLLVLHDMPHDWKDFTKIKSLTGESLRTERGFHQDTSENFDSMLKIFVSCNYVPKIPDKEKNPMYSRRLSLIKNTRQDPYPINSELEFDVVKEESEHIVSWLVNLNEIKCEYEKPEEVRDSWESEASPELEFIEKFYDFGDTGFGEPLRNILKNFKTYHPESLLNIKELGDSLLNQGFPVRLGMVKNIVSKPIESKKQTPQTKLN